MKEQITVNFNMINCRNTILFLLFVVVQVQCLRAQNLIPFREGNQWGFSTDDGEITIEPQFDRVGKFVDSVTWVKRGSKFAFINSSGGFVTKFKFDSVENFYAGRAEVVSGRKEYEIDLRGKRVKRRPRLSRCGIGCGIRFNSYSENGKYGFIVFAPTEESRRAKTPAIWDNYTYGCHGIAAVQKDGKWKLINEDIELISDSEFDEVKFCKGYSKEGLIIVKLNGKYGFIDKTGRIVVEAIYTKVECFDALDDLTRVWVDEDFWGYINKNGQEFFNR